MLDKPEPKIQWPITGWVLCDGPEQASAQYHKPTNSWERPVYNYEFYSNSTWDDTLQIIDFVKEELINYEVHDYVAAIRFLCNPSMDRKDDFSMTRKTMIVFMFDEILKKNA